jgi:hypothetical protein
MHVCLQYKMRTGSDSAAQNVKNGWFKFMCTIELVTLMANREWLG